MTQEKLNILRLATDEVILDNTAKIIQEERRLTAELLHHLREIDRRMIYAKMGHASLYDMLVSHFGYSSGAAYRRISTMRLLREIPALEEKVISGALSLTSAAKAQSFFKEVKLEKAVGLTVAEKTEVIEQIENKSTREVEKILLHLSPNLIPKDRARQITDQLTEIKFIADENLREKLERLKQLISNKIPAAGYRDVINEASDIAITQLDKRNLKKDGSQNLRPLNNEASLNLRHAKPALGSDLRRVNPANNSRYMSKNSSGKFNLSTSGDATSGDVDSEAVSSASNSRPYISIRIKEQVWQKCDSKCSFKSEPDAAVCGSRYRLAIDHILPVAMGGATELENLRLLCQTHNLYEAKRLFGLDHMAKHVKKFL